MSVFLCPRYTTLESTTHTALHAVCVVEWEAVKLRLCQRDPGCMMPEKRTVQLAGTSEVWQFLSPWSDMYDLEDDGSFLRTVGTGLGTAKFNVKRFAGDIANELEACR